MRSLALLATTTGAAAAAPAGGPSVTLNNGVKMPVLGFAASVWDPDTCKSATAAALSAGFRNVWSSILVGGDCQQQQGAAIAAAGIARGELFIAGTVNTGGCTGTDSCYTQTKSDAEGQFTSLGVKTLDMIMLDYPGGDCPGIQGQWKAFSELYAAKRVRSIAVSNFDSSQLDCVTANKSVVPVANQLSYCVGNSGTMVKDNAKYGIVVQAYSPLGGGSVVSDPDCVAIGKAHGKSAAQVALRWIYQTNATIATESTNPDYLKEDAAIWDFTLTDAEMAKLSGKGATRK